MFLILFKFLILRYLLLACLGLKCVESAGFYGIPGACSAVYYVCAEGLVTEKICPGGAVFDSDKNVCAPVQSVPCASKIFYNSCTPSQNTRKDLISCFKFRFYNVDDYVDIDIDSIDYVSFHNDPWLDNYQRAKWW